MIRSRLGFKALGLCALVLGLMAVSVSAAQAAKWEVGGSTALLASIQIKEIEKLNPGVDELRDASLNATIGGAAVSIRCEGAELINVKIEGNNTGKLELGGKVKFTLCETWLNGVLSKVCTAKSAGQANGTIVTNEGEGELKLSGTAKVVLLKPDNAKEEFVNIELGEECSIGENAPVLGCLALEDPALETNSVDHLIRENAANTSLGLISLANKATIKGSAITTLTGAHAGKLWRGLAE